MATKKIKKDFDKERMYAKIMPSVFIDPTPATAAAEKQDDAPTETTSAPIAEPAYILRNYMEDIILEKFAHTMRMLKACPCEKCKKDVMAHALNALPPSYMAVKPDMVEQSVRELRAGMEVKVSTALIQAVQHVKANPRHE